MADVEAGPGPPFESPVVAGPGPETAGGDGPVMITDLSETRKVLLRADHDGPAARRLAVDFAASRRQGSVMIWGLRPSEWLLLGPAAAVDHLVDDLDVSGHVSVVDLTHGLALFRLTGRAAARLLEKICSLDWGDPMTPDGAVVSASVAKVGCDIARHDLGGRRNGGGETRPSYLLACDRSFGSYLFDAMVDAGREFGIGIVGPTPEEAGPCDGPGRS